MHLIRENIQQSEISLAEISGYILHTYFLWLLMDWRAPRSPSPLLRFPLLLLELGVERWWGGSGLTLSPLYLTISSPTLALQIASGSINAGGCIGEKKEKSFHFKSHCFCFFQTPTSGNQSLLWAQGVDGIWKISWGAKSIVLSVFCAWGWVQFNPNFPCGSDLLLPTEFSHYVTKQRKLSPCNENASWDLHLMLYLKKRPWG